MKNNEAKARLDRIFFPSLIIFFYSSHHSNEFLERDGYVWQKIPSIDYLRPRKESNRILYNYDWIIIEFESQSICKQKKNEDWNSKKKSTGEKNALPFF